MENFLQEMAPSKKQRKIDQKAFDMQQEADELASKQAERIKHLETKCKIAISQCGWFKRRVQSYKKVIQELMAAGDDIYTGPYGDMYAVPSIGQMQKINMDLRRYDALREQQIGEQQFDEISVSVSDNPDDDVKQCSDSDDDVGMNAQNMMES